MLTPTLKEVFSVNTTRKVIVSEGDYARILSSLEKAKMDLADPLREELDTATIVPDQELPANIVNMGAEVTFRDLESGASSSCTLVYPHQADAATQRVSVLAPVGAALIGLAEGETIAWPIPGGKLRKLQVVAVEQNRMVAGDP
jgi:regulator of nucleoside diphosphate kinase